MKKILFACGVALLAACSHKTAPVASTPPPPAPAPAHATTAPATSSVEAGHQVYNAKCGRCHALYEPSNYSSERWVPILQAMAPKARLSEEETAQVRAYVQANAKK